MVYGNRENFEINAKKAYESFLFSDKHLFGFHIASLFGESSCQRRCLHLKRRKIGERTGRKNGKKRKNGRKRTGKRKKNGDRPAPSGLRSTLNNFYVILSLFSHVHKTFLL